jgi:SAM-dependent methyltransferase
MRKEEYQRIFELEESHWWYLGISKISEVLLLPLIKEGKGLKILDAGCGAGGMMKRLKKFGEVQGIDISPEALKFCRKRGLKEIKLASIEKIPFENESFDLVTSFDVLYHQWVENDSAAYKEIYRVLKPEGYFLIRVPAYNWLRGKHDKIVFTRHRYTREELVTETRSAGFKVLRATYANTFLFPFAIAKRFLEKILPEEKNSDVKPLPNFLNSLFTKILYLEAAAVSKFNLPFGLSLFVLAQKEPTDSFSIRKHRLVV